MKWENILKLRVDASLHEAVDAMIESMYSKLFGDDTLTSDNQMNYVDTIIDKHFRPKLLNQVQEFINEFKPTFD